MDSLPSSTPSFRVLLVSFFLYVGRDVLRSIDYLHSVKKRCHRNLSTLNVVIVNGRAKITGMVNDASTSKTKQDYQLDYKHLANIVRTCFGSEQQNIPTELKLFLAYISRSKDSKSSRYVNRLLETSLYTYTCIKTYIYMTWNSYL